MNGSTAVGMVYLGEKPSTTVEISLPDLPGAMYFWKTVFTTDNNAYSPSIPTLMDPIEVGACTGESIHE